MERWMTTTRKVVLMTSLHLVRKNSSEHSVCSEQWKSQNTIKVNRPVKSLFGLCSLRPDIHACPVSNRIHLVAESFQLRSFCLC